jgi:hypothetical protein
MDPAQRLLLEVAYETFENSEFGYFMWVFEGFLAWLNLGTHRRRNSNRHTTRE